MPPAVGAVGVARLVETCPFCAVTGPQVMPGPLRWPQRPRPQEGGEGPPPLAPAPHSATPQPSGGHGRVVADVLCPPLENGHDRG